MEKSYNPSAVRSRQMIIDALLDLMKTKKYTEITVTDLAMQAQIVRKTFYRHFYTLDDVLDEYVDQLFEDYKQMLKKASIHNIYEHIPLYFTFWHQHMPFLLVLNKNNLLNFVLNKYNSLMPEVFSMLPCNIKDNPMIKDYFFSYTAGAFWNMLCTWVKRGGKESPEQMTAIFRHFFSQVAAANFEMKQPATV